VLCGSDQTPQLRGTTSLTGAASSAREFAAGWGGYEAAACRGPVLAVLPPPTGLRSLRFGPAPRLDRGPGGHLPPSEPDVWLSRIQLPGLSPSNPRMEQRPATEVPDHGRQNPKRSAGTGWRCDRTPRPRRAGCRGPSVGAMDRDHVRRQGATARVSARSSSRRAPRRPERRSVPHPPRSRLVAATGRACGGLPRYAPSPARAP
jgi:hypothetical protein